MKQNLSFTEQLLFTTARVECKDMTGASSFGTAFFYRANARVRPDGKFDSEHVLVTNRHVAEGAVSTTFHLHILGADGQPALGLQQAITIDIPNAWILHPTLDLAFCGLYLHTELLKKEGYTPFYLGIEKDLIASPSELQAVMPAEQILMIGYPIGLWDNVNNLPIIRSGILASLPAANFQGRAEFVIDCACYPGSSGSPVFQVNFGRKLTKDGVDVGAFGAKLIGVLWGGPTHNAVGQIVSAPVPTAATQSLTKVMINLGYCIKAFCLSDIDEMIMKIMLENKKDGIHRIQQEIIDGHH